MSDLFTLLEVVEPTALRDWMSLDSRQSVLRLQLHWTDATAYAPFLAHARAAVTTTFAPNTSCRFVGPGYEMVARLSSLLNDLRGAFQLAFLLEFLLEATTPGDFSPGDSAKPDRLVAEPAARARGSDLDGVFDMRVDIHTLLLAPIALGVVTDDTAHFMHGVRQRISTTGNVEQALTETMRDGGRSIVINKATLTAGFGVYLVAGMQGMQKLARLVMLTIVLSLLADLGFTPALVRITFRRYGRVLAQST